jgi:hypothetical protein
MSGHRRSISTLTLIAAFAILSAPFTCAAQLAERPAQSQARTAHPDSKEVNDLLNLARIQALQLKTDASEMKAFTHQDLGWESHADKINAIKKDVDSLCQTAAKLNNVESDASPWQKAAITRIRPLLKELADNTTSVINHLNKEQGRFLYTPEHKDLLQANADLSADLSAMVSNYVDYGKTRSKFFELQQKLELSEGRGQ